MKTMDGRIVEEKGGDGQIQQFEKPQVRKSESDLLLRACAFAISVKNDFLRFVKAELTLRRRADDTHTINVLSQGGALWTAND